MLASSAVSNRIAVHPRGFTLVELLVSMAIIGVLASLMLVALFGAQEEARRARTETQIAKIHELIMSKWEEYEGRSVQFTYIEPDLSSFVGAEREVERVKSIHRQRLQALRATQRMELPDRISNVTDEALHPVDSSKRLIQRPALSSAYQRQNTLLTSSTSKPWSENFQNAECLYLIISHMRKDGRNAIEFFSKDEIGDVDNDGRPEILDGWGNPIMFVRWAPGFVAPYSTIHFGDQNPAVDGDASPPSSGTVLNDPLGASSYDPFDPLQVDLRWSDTVTDNDPFPLYPLIFSAGPDGSNDLGSAYGVGFAFSASDTNYKQDDPFSKSQDGDYLGVVVDHNATVDNIHNHFLIVR